MKTLLRYPLLLVHGLGFRDDMTLSYWGRIPQALEAFGCQVFLSGQDGGGNAEHNGAQVARRINEILKLTGAEKVNIIAHSKGGLDSRYAISSLNMADKVASLTTLATPHHGSKSIDMIMKLPDPVIRFAGACADGWFRLIGDQAPSTHQILRSFTTEEASLFNAQNPDREGVFYQSYAFVMDKPLADPLLWLSNLVVQRIEGENDGLLPPDAVKWGNFRGVYRSSQRRGISHLDQIDLRRRPMSKSSPEGVLDILDIYRDIVKELAEKGF